VWTNGHRIPPCPYLRQHHIQTGSVPVNLQLKFHRFVLGDCYCRRLAEISKPVWQITHVQCSERLALACSRQQWPWESSSWRAVGDATAITIAPWLYRGLCNDLHANSSVQLRSRYISLNQQTSHFAYVDFRTPKSQNCWPARNAGTSYYFYIGGFPCSVVNRVVIPRRRVVISSSR